MDVVQLDGVDQKQKQKQKEKKKKGNKKDNYKSRPKRNNKNHNRPTTQFKNDAEKYARIVNILKNLNEQSYDSLKKELLNILKDNIENEKEMCKRVIFAIVDTAIGEKQALGSVYATLCRDLRDNEAVFRYQYFPVKFILNKCQEVFERSDDDKSAESNIGADLNRRMIRGIVNFICALFEHEMLSEKIVHGVIKQLLGIDAESAVMPSFTIIMSLEDTLEQLCKLMTVIGKTVDNGKQLNTYFGKMAELSTNKQLSIRIRNMLLEVIDLRKRGWRKDPSDLSSSKPSNASANNNKPSAKTTIKKQHYTTIIEDRLAKEYEQLSSRSQTESLMQRVKQDEVPCLSSVQVSITQKREEQLLYYMTLGLDSVEIQVLMSNSMNMKREEVGKMIQRLVESNHPIAVKWYQTSELLKMYRAITYEYDPNLAEYMGFNIKEMSTLNTQLQSEVSARSKIEKENKQLQRDIVQLLTEMSTLNTQLQSEVTARSKVEKENKQLQSESVLLRKELKQHTEQNKELKKLHIEVLQREAQNQLLGKNIPVQMGNREKENCTIS